MHIVSNIGIATSDQNIDPAVPIFPKKERIVILAVTILASVTSVLGEIMKDILRGQWGVIEHRGKWNCPGAL